MNRWAVPTLAIALTALIGGCRAYLERIPAPVTSGDSAASVDRADLPRDAVMEFLHAQQATQRGDLVSSLDHLRRAALFHPDSPALHVRVAMGEHLLGRPQSAQRQCLAALRADAEYCEAHLLAGRIASYQLDLESAEMHLQLAIECDPSLDDAWTGMASLLWTQRRIPEYLELLDAMEPHFPDEGWILRRRGEALRLAQRTEEAIDALADAVRIDTEDRDSRASLLALYQELDRLEDARLFMEDLVARYPSIVELRVELADIYAALGCYDLMIEQLLTQYEQEPDHRDVYALEAASWLEHLLRFEEAIDLLERTLEDYGQEPSLLMRLGWVHEAAGDADAALKAWSRVEPGAPYWSFAVEERARVLAESDRQTEAIELLRDSIEAAESRGAPVHAEIRVQLAHILIDQDLYDDAVGALEPLRLEVSDLHAREMARVVWARGDTSRAHVLLNKQIGQEGIEPRASLVLASLFRDEGLFDEAITVLGAALERLEAPNAEQQLPIGRYPTLQLRQAQIFDFRINVQTSLGFLQSLAGDNQAAIRTMELVLEADPDNARAMNFVGYTLAVENRDLDEAERLLLRALILQPLDPAILDSYGWLLFRQGRLDEALDSLLQASRRMPESAVIWQHIGEVQLALGNEEEARAALAKCGEQVDATDPEEVQAAERAREILLQLEGRLP